MAIDSLSFIVPVITATITGIAAYSAARLKAKTDIRASDERLEEIAQKQRNDVIALTQEAWKALTAAMQQRIDQLDEHVRAQDLTIAAQNQSIQTLNQTIAQLNQTVLDQNRKISDQDELIAAQAITIADLSAGVDILTAQLTALGCPPQWTGKKRSKKGGVTPVE